MLEDTAENAGQCTCRSRHTWVWISRHVSDLSKPRREMRVMRLIPRKPWRKNERMSRIDCADWPNGGGFLSLNFGVQI